MTGVAKIKGTITLADGTESEFQITTDVSWIQWGASRERLGESVDVLEAIADAAREFMADEDDEEEE